MRNIYSNIFKINKKNIFKTVNFLKKKDLAALPTETVYGLAGNAYSDISVKKIYRIKKRPKKNPLIIHYHSLSQIRKDAILNKDFFKLYRKFCPGPLTFILKKKKTSKVSSFATAKLKTIAVRIPRNKVIRQILKLIDFPLAMPSANKSTKVSSVTAQNVVNEFDKTIRIILDGGRSKIGIESTVIDLTLGAKILRPGLILPSNISRILKKKVKIIKNTKNIKSPGQLKKHYSPGIPIKLNQKKIKKNIAFIAFGKKYKTGKNIFNLSYKSDLNEAARNLYRILRTIKNCHYKMIYVSKIPQKGIGIAINDRLNRAAN